MSCVVGSSAHSLAAIIDAGNWMTLLGKVSAGSDKRVAVVLEVEPAATDKLAGRSLLTKLPHSKSFFGDADILGGVPTIHPTIRENANTHLFNRRGTALVTRHSHLILQF